MINWSKRTMWTPPDFERPAAGEWDGDPNAMPGGWKGKWTVIVPDPARQDSIGLSRSVSPGRPTDGGFSFWSSRKDALRPVMFGSEDDAVAVVRAFAEWAEANGWFELSIRRYCKEDPAKSEQKSKSGEWIPFAKAIRVEDYRVQDRPTPKKRGEKKPAAEKTEAKAPQTEKTEKESRESASPCRFLDFDPDCLEKKESARGPHGIRDLRSGMWLACSGGRWFRTESEAERAVFRSREEAADALCALEQRLWSSELASLRPAIEKIA